MRDVDTGKLMRDVETGKLMRAVEAYDCAACFAPGRTPLYYTLTFAGVLLCPARAWPGGVNLNRKWFLAQYDPIALPCYWRYSDVNWLIYIQFDVGDPSKTWVRAYQPPGNFYFSFYIDEACFIDGVAYSIYDVGDCGANVWGHHGAVLIEQGTVYGTQQRRLPNGDSSVQWNPTSNNYLLVDDPIGSPDDDASYTYTNVQTNKDYFDFSSFVVPSGCTITNVKAVGRFKRVDAGGAEIIRLLIKVGGTTYVGTSTQLVVGAYFDVTHVWTTNPKTGLAWTVDDVNGIGVNALQSVGYECIIFGKTVRCTQVYVETNYTH